MLALPTTATTNINTSTRHLYYIYPRFGRICFQQHPYPRFAGFGCERAWRKCDMGVPWAKNEGPSLLMLKCYRWDRSAHSWVIQEALLITPTTPKWFSKKDSQMLEFPYFLSIFPWFMDRNHTIVQLNPRVISNMAKKTAKHCYSVGSKLTIDPHWSW